MYSNDSRDGQDNADTLVDLEVTVTTAASDNNVDPISASRAVLWLSPPNERDSPVTAQAGVTVVDLVKSLLAQGAGQVALARTSRYFNGGISEDTRLWLPTDVRAAPPRQRFPRKQGVASRTNSHGKIVDVVAAESPSEEGVDGGAQRRNRFPSCQGLLSPCLAEALGLSLEPSSFTATATATATSADQDSDEEVKLIVRKLRGFRPAIRVDFRGPYLMRPPNGGNDTQMSGEADGSQQPAKSLVAAVSSILPSALEGEVMAVGSVFFVAGLFKVIVTATQSTGQSEKYVLHQRQPRQPMSELRAMQTTRRQLALNTGPVNVHSGTDLRLIALPPSRPTSHSAQKKKHPSTHNRKGQQTAASGTGSFHYDTSRPGGPVERPSPRKSDERTGESAQQCSIRPTGVNPAFDNCPAEEEWIRCVQEDFGGGEREVKAAVGAARAVLRLCEEFATDAGGSVCCGGGTTGWLNSPAGGLLLYGPTGAGKTLFARSVAEHSGLPWFFVDCSSVFRRDRGKAEQHVQDVLEEAGASSPSIVVLDQVDTVSKRRPEVAGITELQVFSVLLETIDRFTRQRPQMNVFFLATCIDPTLLDPSLLQRGRLESVLRLGSLDALSRASILEIHARGMPLQLLPLPASGVPLDTTPLPGQEQCAVKISDLGSIAVNVANVKDNTAARKVPGAPETGDSAENVYNRGENVESSRDESVSMDKLVDPSKATPNAKVPAGGQPTPQVLTPPLSRPRSRAEFFRLVAARCHGYLGSDLERLCREAAMRHMVSCKTRDLVDSRSDVLKRDMNDGNSCSLESVHQHPGHEGNPGTRAVNTSPIVKSEEKAHTGAEAEGRTSRRSNGDAVMESGSWNVVDDDGVRLQDFWAALETVRPASLVGQAVGMWGGDGGRETEKPLVGCDAAMAELRVHLLAPLAHPSLLRKLGLRAATGALLHGPPGCGKTSVARALAAETRGLANFLEVRCSDLVDKVVGRSERSVSDLFTAARAAAPCVLFLDQVEGVAARRGYHSSTEQTFDRILSTLLVEMDGVMSESGGHVVVLAATNDITRLDPALLRPGRLDRRVYLGPPDFAARAAIFKQRLLEMPLRFASREGDHEPTATAFERGHGWRKGSIEGGGGGDVVGGCSGDFEGISSEQERPVGISSKATEGREFDSTEAYANWLAGETEGCSGAQVTGVCREAALAALREDIEGKEVALRHFEAALRSCRRQG